MPAIKKPAVKSSPKPGRETLKKSKPNALENFLEEAEASREGSPPDADNEPNDMMNKAYETYLATCKESGVDPYALKSFAAVGDITKATDILVERRTKPAKPVKPVKDDTAPAKKTKPANSGRAKGDFTPKDRAKLRKLVKDGKLPERKWGEAWVMTDEIAAALGRTVATPEGE